MRGAASGAEAAPRPQANSLFSGDNGHPKTIDSAFIGYYIMRKYPPGFFSRSHSRLFELKKDKDNALNKFYLSYGELESGVIGMFEFTAPSAGASSPIFIFSDKCVLPIDKAWKYNKDRETWNEDPKRSNCPNDKDKKCRLKLEKIPRTYSRLRDLVLIHDYSKFLQDTEMDKLDTARYTEEQWFANPELGGADAMEEHLGLGPGVGRGDTMSRAPTTVEGRK